VSPTPLKPELEPDEQSLAVVTSLWSTALGWFRGGNTIVRIGVLVLLVGVVLLLRLASHYFDTPIELRLSLVALGGLGLAAFGLKLRESRRGYGLSLQGAGLATLYLTLFAAYRLYALLPSGLTFALLAVLASVTAVLAVRQDALPLAVLAFGGAFASPILTSDGSGDVVGLFSYYLLLNAALAWIAHYRTWRVLNLLGVLFTFGVAGAWGLQQFNPALRWPLEALLLAHVALYLFIVVRYSQQLVRAASDQPTLRVPVVDSGLLFGVPLMAFGLQAGLFHGMPYALAVSSAVLSGVYLLLGRHLVRQGSGLRLLTEGTLALGVGFLALVLPLALNAQWTSVGWAIQGAGLVWMGQRQARGWPVAFGLLLQVLSVAVMGWVWFSPSGTPLLLGLALLVLSVWASAGFLRHATTDQRHVLSWGVLLAAQPITVLWLAQCEQRAPLWWANQSGVLHGVVELLLISTAGLLLLRRLIWPALQGLLRGLLPLSGVLLMCHLTAQINRSPLWVVLLLSLALMVLGALLLMQVPRRGGQTRIDQALWVLGTVVLAGLWSDAAWPSAQPLTPVLLPVVLLLGLVYCPSAPQWLNIRQVLTDIGLWVLAFFGLWVLVVNGQASGQQWGLPYVPVINPLDITLLLVGLFAYWDTQRRWARPQPLAVSVLLGLAGFWSLTGLVLRTLHQWVQTPLWTGGAWQSDTVQTTLTIVWTLLAVLLTGVASRGSLTNSRSVWLAGIVLLGVVVAKLLLVDLSNVGAVARVISFIGAGLMMLLIGYIAPLPPANRPLAVDEPSPQAADSSDQDTPP
jgi:uncharacterized membrane protein